ncbi:MAG: hypothetical protein K6E56_03770 [Lachnospiraceae bacterium]|nr:hypothetical protein [Lachnospiraceae bacterium]
MASVVTNHKCINCSGPLHFDETIGKLKCDYCDSTFTVEEVEEFYKDKEEAAEEAFDPSKAKVESDWDTSGIKSDWDKEDLKMVSYTCPSCSGEIICDENTAATCCPYCGNPTVIPGQFKDDLKPDFIIPFKLSKEEAVEALKKHYKGKFFLNKRFKDDNHINEIQGLYVPFWLYSGVAHADMSFHATRVMRHREGDYEVVNTSHYNIRRSGDLAFNDIPADASVKMDDDFMDSIEPFDYCDFKEFSTAYMPGFLADRYDVSAEECSKRADLRASNSTASMLRDDVVGYATVTETGRSISINKGFVKYVMMPVWILNTKYRDKNFQFMMNGQTGKLVGNLPIDWPKVAVFTVILTAILSFGAYFVGIGGAIARLFI